MDSRYIIITPYAREDQALLERCIDSVRRQTVRTDHFLVADGYPQEWIGRMSPPSAVITNPPRAGMAGSVVRGLLTRRPGRLVYISCDPATLARDLSRLGAAYRVSAFRCFDLFPQTAHVETVVRLDRA